MDRLPLEARARRRRWLLLSLVANLGMLAVFKYGDFAAAHDRGCGTPRSARTVRLDSLGLVLPMGISFYTFQTLSYTIDVYRGQLRADRAASRASCSSSASSRSWSPARSSGPASSCRRSPGPRRLRLRVFYEGVWLLICGFFLKMVCADNLAAYVDEYWARGSRARHRRDVRAVAGR